jgi:hypothetical protein
MEPETEIVSDAPMRSRRKAAKKATARGAEKPGVTGFGAVLQSAEPTVDEGAAGEEREQQLPDQAQLEVVVRQPDEEIRELVVERLAANPRMVLASYEEDGVKRVVKVWVGVNRNFKVRLRLRAQRGAGENAPWKLVGQRPRLPGRW